MAGWKIPQLNGRSPTNSLFSSTPCLIPGEGTSRKGNQCLGETAIWIQLPQLGPMCGAPCPRPHAGQATLEVVIEAKILETSKARNFCACGEVHFVVECK